jgi:hypothetical protein
VSQPRQHNDRGCTCLLNSDEERTVDMGTRAAMSFCVEPI